MNNKCIWVFVFFLKKHTFLQLTLFSLFEDIFLHNIYNSHL